MLLAVACAQLFSSQAIFANQPTRPNIILIMADDMGYSDIGCYGGEIETPNLDRLAAGGVRFTQFYNTARCCPTRASLLTGLYQHQAGIGHMQNDLGYDGYRGDLNDRCVTIAEVLRESGYGTYMAGKWHVTKHIGPDCPRHNWPRQRGFDRFYGTITGAGDFYDPPTLTRDNTMLTIHTDKEYPAKDYYYTDAISDHAVRFIGEHLDNDADRPFFAYVSYTAAHWPMQAPDEAVGKYEGRYAGGYAPIRRARFDKIRELGLINSSCQLTECVGEWPNVKHKEWEARCMEVYAAMVDVMDQGIGRIVKELERRGELDETLILYLQDNGGCAEGTGRRPRPDFSKRPASAPFKPLAADEIVTTYKPSQTRDGYPMLRGPQVMPGPRDTFIAYGKNWANVSNTPFREYKHWVHEGGISTPLIAHWPEGIREPGRLVHDPAHLIDIMATCVHIGDAPYPTEKGDVDVVPFEGTSLVGVFRQTQPIYKRAIFFEHEGNRAVRKGDWKLVAKAGRPWELYNMVSDRSETTDLAEDRPELVDGLKTEWNKWADRANVRPYDVWRKSRNK
ncbi:arylsulfatase [Stratiformator vulcanicus]|nr:arylsulfatase [Stratiformator vulcanicus]